MPPALATPRWQPTSRMQYAPARAVVLAVVSQAPKPASHIGEGPAAGQLAQHHPAAQGPAEGELQVDVAWVHHIRLHGCVQLLVVRCK